MLKRIFAFLLILASWFPCTEASAGIYTDDLARCLVDSATQSDREKFDLWLLSALNTHPAFRPYSNMTDEQRETITKQAAEMLVRLLAVDCRKQAVGAVKNEGRSSYVTAFGVLGETAMNWLMNDEQVGRSTRHIDQFLDKAKLSAIFNEAGASSSLAVPVTPAVVSSATARLAISRLSEKDWSVTDGDVLVKRIVDASSQEGLHALAAAGDARAETLEGIGLLLGAAGFPRDESAAARDLQLASKSGFAPALVMMGFIYQYGMAGLAQDDGAAVGLYRKAADLGDAGGQMCLADMYIAGRGGLAKDRSKAVQLYRLSSKQGDKQAADRLAALGETP